MANTIDFEDELLAEMLGDFLDESDEILVVLNESLLSLDEWVKEAGDGAKCDEELMNEMFRAAHSLKGLSAMLRLDAINVLTHKMENVFDAARNDELAITPAVLETVFQAVDRLTLMIEALRKRSEEEVDATEVTQRIQDLLDQNGATKEVVSMDEANALLETVAEPASRSSSSTSETKHVEQHKYFEGVIDETDIADNYLAIFVDETTQALDEMSEQLVEGSDMVVDSLMIFCHRIKGSAASIGLNRAAKLSHAMEDILQERMQSGGVISADLCDALLACTDTLRVYIDQLPDADAIDPEFEHAFRTLMDAGAIESDEVPVAPTREVLSKQNRFTDAVVAELSIGSANAHDLLLVDIVFEPDFPLVELKAKLVIDRATQLGDLTFCEPGEDTLDQLPELNSLSIAIDAPGVSDLEEIRRNLNAEGVAHIDIRRAAEKPATTNAPAASIVKQESPKENAATNSTPDAISGEQPAGSKSANGKSRPAETLRVDIDRLDQLMNLAGQLVINKARFVQIGDKIRDASKVKGLESTIDDACTRLDAISKQSRDSTRNTWSQTVALQTEQIRGDLASVQEHVANLSQMRFLVNDLLEAVHQLDRVADGIQKSVMDTRMVPIGPLFSRFKRVVRDLTRQSGKDVALEINGEKTELDKRMIDELGDPLIHMVRNSVDHGIESPQERIEAGKPSQGTVKLEAFHRGNRIVIRISDDGRGLPLEKIVKKAIDKGLVSDTDAEKLTKEQICQLIWHPGFSTAEKVTEVSGRGMGMDIVRAKIEELNGSVDLDSTPGEGSVFTIRLPLTMAILPSLLAKIDGDVFAIPVESVVEIVRIKKSELHGVQGSVTARVRNRIVSIVNLSEVLTWNDRPAADLNEDPNPEVTLVIMGADDLESGLVVDELIGEEDVVIKSLAENYQNIQGIAGASILGDGRVSLILDVASLLSMISNGQTGTSEMATIENEQQLEATL